MEILGLTNFKVSTDGKMINVVFETDHGASEMSFNAETLQEILQQLSGVIWEANKLAETDTKRKIRAVPTPSQVGVRPTHSGQAVILRFLMENHLEFLFALSNQAVDHLLAQIGAARNPGGSHPI